MDSKEVPEITPEMLQENPGLAFCLLGFTALIFLAFSGSLTTWTVLIFRLVRREPILQVERWTPRPWGLSEIVLTLICLVVTQVILTSAFAPFLGIDLQALANAEEGQEQPLPLSLSAVVSAGYLLSVFLVSAWVIFRFNSSLDILGWGLSRFPRQVMIGIIAGLGFLPFMFALNAIVTIASKVDYEHPILEAMISEATLGSWLLAGFSAVIAAPIAEEFLFRVLLQGWLQSIPFVPWYNAIIGRMELAASPTLAVSAVNGSALEVPEHPSESILPPNQPNLGSVPADEEAGDTPPLPPIWPSLVAGTLFGLAHWGYGLSFIPLIGLGIFLGLLYRATQSIWPCIIVHFMLNATALAGLGLSVYINRVAGG